MVGRTRTEGRMILDGTSWIMFANDFSMWRYSGSIECSMFDLDVLGIGYGVLGTSLARVYVDPERAEGYLT